MSGNRAAKKAQINMGDKLDIHWPIDVYITAKGILDNNDDFV